MGQIEGNYGWTKDIYAQARAVVDCLGGGDVAYRLILETVATETALGKIHDRTIYAGMGIAQFDEKPFYRIRDISTRYRDQIENGLGIDIKLVRWGDLRYNPFLSLIFCRLYYLAIPAPIPITLEKRASYWKQFYNSYLGKGTTAHYEKMVYSYLNLEDNPYVISSGAISE